MKDRKEIETRVDRIEAALGILARKVLSGDELDSLLLDLGPPTTGLSATKVDVVTPSRADRR